MDLVELDLDCFARCAAYVCMYVCMYNERFVLAGWVCILLELKCTLIYTHIDIHTWEISSYRLVSQIREEKKNKRKRTRYVMFILSVSPPFYAYLLSKFE